MIPPNCELFVFLGRVTFYSAAVEEYLAELRALVEKDLSWGDCLKKQTSDNIDAVEPLLQTIGTPEAMGARTWATAARSLLSRRNGAVHALWAHRPEEHGVAPVAVHVRSNKHTDQEDLRVLGDDLKEHSRQWEQLGKLRMYGFPGVTVFLKAPK